jgi:arabinan endo-1,5-alpha-L-arabinosidase
MERTVLERRLPSTCLAAVLAVLLVIAAFSRLAHAATSGANGTHDPSRMIESDGKLYVYSTGGGSKSSPDGLVWTSGPGIFAGGAIPESVRSVVPDNQGIWAPDVIFLNGLYYLYYSIANETCAVGLVTSPTLDPSSAKYKWTDRGVVVSSNTSATYCTIDPAPALDADGNLWLAWGSGYSHASTDDTLFVTRLDNTTGLASSADSAKPGHALQKGHIEAAYLYYHSGYYYLFWNSGGCCDGASSSYLIHVARSQSVTGSYTGSKNFYGSTGSIHGPGHLGIYDSCGASRITYHYYPDSGGSVLGENELSWGNDGWPVLGPVSTTPIKPCGMMGGGSDGTGGSAGSNGGVGGVTGIGGAAGGDSSPGGNGTAGNAGMPSTPNGGGITAGVPATAGASAGSGGMTSGGSALSAGGTSNEPSDAGCSCRFQQQTRAGHGTLALLALSALFGVGRSRSLKPKSRAVVACRACSRETALRRRASAGGVRTARRARRESRW